MTLFAPGFIIDMTPPRPQISLLELLSAGLFFIQTVGDPGSHGPVGVGTQGTGPAGVGGTALQVPKGITLAIGLLSIIFAAGFPSIITILSGKIIRGVGAAPIVH